ncbi:hypothetical protein B0H63DRAFT_480646 [Podospora didyma]|uniref:Secreted protein n=1 Tax=Podospora didyma TaxID=330526 RepID=A0AAE0N8F9_9PEZI|nr:hypothetical protein B0H63DRAFT_480646 [Podospora didyma]
MMRGQKQAVCLTLCFLRSPVISWESFSFLKEDLSCEVGDLDLRSSISVFLGNCEKQFGNCRSSDARQKVKSCSEHHFGFAIPSR